MKSSVETDLDRYKIMSDGEIADPVSLTEKGFIDIARIENGGSFGVNALIDRKPRMSTAKCLTRCHLLVLTYPEWKISEGLIEAKKVKERVEFVK